jgi:hypothetical protein
MKAENDTRKTDASVKPQNNYTEKGISISPPSSVPPPPEPTKKK